MVAEPRSSDPVDPLSAYSGLALFPRTFGVAPDPSKPYDPDTDLDAIHNHLKSLALQCPNKFLEEAKMVLDGSSELANYPAIKEKNSAVEDKESLQARRPALGRKRARFFLKSNLIQPTESLEPSLDIEQLKDPEEFFLAYERLENAKRELQKQIGGVSLDLNQHNPSKTARQRRPGILGRSVRYKHRYSSLISENNENILSSQETFDSGIVSPTNDISHCKTDQDLASKERYTAGSMDNPESKVSEILDELLSGNFEDLEGDRAVSILQKRLQIKPIDLEKLNLPEFRDIQKINLKSSRQNMPRPRKALADIDNMLKGISSKSHVKLIPEAESPFNHKSSPTPPTSLSASLSVLQRQILSSKSSNDPFPNPDFGHSPAKNSSSTECTLKESDLDHTGMQLSNCDELKSPLVEEDNIDNLLKGISSKTLVKLIQEAKSPFHHRASPTPPRSPFASLSLLQRQILQSKPSNDPFSIPYFGDSPAKNSSPIECMPKESDLNHTGMQPSNCNELKSPLVEEDDIATAKTGSQDVAIEDVTCTSEAIVHDNSSKLSFRVDVGSSGTYVDMEDNVGGSMDIEVTDEQLSRHDADIDAQEISLLQRQILQSRPSNDPFSIPYFGHSPAKNSSPIECMPKESDLDHTGMQLSNCNELKSPLVGVDDIATAKTSSQDVAIENVTCTSEAIVHDNCSKLSFCVDVRSSGTLVDMEDNVGDSMDIEVTNEQLSRHDADIDAQENGSNKLEDKVEDMLQEPVEAVASPECSVNMVDSTGENLNCIRTPLDQSNPAVVEDRAVHGLSQAPDNVPEQNIEKIQESIEVSLNKQIKAKSRLHKNKERSHRQSLAGAGLLWKSGLRRSTRIRTRPLEYWKGERLLYGRIHQSLTTVIGLKYVSPTKGDDGKPALKVKSYVSDEYKELVELAALH